jgi:hypothetical protein
VIHIRRKKGNHEKEQKEKKRKGIMDRLYELWGKVSSLMGLNT